MRSGYPVFHHYPPMLDDVVSQVIEEILVPCGTPGHSIWMSCQMPNMGTSCTYVRRGFSFDTRVKTDKWWAQSLYNSVDGKESCECGRSNILNTWIDAGSYFINGRDYVNYHHVWITCLPTSIRISRGRRWTQRETRCRAGCNITESYA